MLGSATVAVVVLLLVRRYAPEGGRYSDGDRTAGVFQVLATGFSVLLGFVIFLAFTSYDNSKSGAETEAFLVAQQFETAQYLSPSIRPRLENELVCYARFVVYESWPRLERGTPFAT